MMTDHQHNKSIDLLPKLRIGIIGAARIARKNVVAIENPASTCVVSCLASRHWEEASSFLTEFCTNHETVTIMSGDEGYQQLVESDLCDAVYIPLPTSMHKDWVLRALDSGKHVLVEKPPAANFEDYAKMIKAAKRSGKYLQDGVTFVHTPQLKEFFDFVCDTEAFGELDRINASFTFWGDDNFFRNDARTQKEMEPLGCIGDLGWYCVRAGVELFCKVGSKSVESAQVVHFQTNEEGVPIDATCLVHFNKGRVLSFHCGFLHATRQRVEVVSSKKSATITDFGIPKKGWNSFQVQEQGFEDSSHHLIENTETVQFESGPSAEVMMWRNFSRYAREVDGSVKAGTMDKEFSNCDHDGIRWGEASEGIERITSFSLLTQRVVGALMESIQRNGIKITL